MLTPAAVTVRPGFWGECVTTRQGRDAIQQATLTGSFEAHSATQAIRWVRVALRTVTPALDQVEGQRAFAWLSHGQWEAVHRVSHGEPFAFEVSTNGLHILWTIRRVLFLPLAHRRAGQLPACAERFACPRPPGAR
ncbi:hypothetical protein OG762_24255 [Streptomyces sp. NBC_01136]|uniref:hypothetical protein n=1 Tax=unclassified Streptomyces TaxID=2593676 RepID=UPI00324FD818|nr:hypothetical protein OG762_24255 [Streptomyces sp. NBC_01136]